MPLCSGCKLLYVPVQSGPFSCHLLRSSLPLLTEYQARKCLPLLTVRSSLFSCSSASAIALFSEAVMDIFGIPDQNAFTKFKVGILISRSVWSGSRRILNPKLRMRVMPSSRANLQSLLQRRSSLRVSKPRSKRYASSCLRYLRVQTDMADIQRRRSLSGTPWYP
jgi:hypothetical protein